MNGLKEVMLLLFAKDEPPPPELLDFCLTVMEVSLINKNQCLLSLVRCLEHQQWRNKFQLSIGRGFHK